MDKKEKDVWKKQAIDIASREAIELKGEIEDLDVLFERAEEIYEKGLKYEWGSKKIKIKKPKREAFDEPKEKVPKKEIKKKKNSEFQSLEEMDKFKDEKGEYSKWKGETKTCPTCNAKIPTPLPLHERSPDGTECGYPFDDSVAGMPSKEDTYKICRRCGEDIPKEWKMHKYSRAGNWCGYKFQERK